MMRRILDSGWWMLTLSCAVAVLMASPPAIVASSTGNLLISHARVVDPVNRVVRTGHLEIRAGIIMGVRPKPPTGWTGAVLDADDRWVIPGLVDLHTHSFGNVGPGVTEMLFTPVAAQRMLHAGVVAFLDLFAMEPVIFAQRDQQREGGVLGAAIFAAGPCITATGGHCTEYGMPTRVIDSPADARREITDLAASRPDVVKIVYDHAPERLPTIDRATLDAAIATAEHHGLKTMIHIGTWQDVADAVEAGATAVTHTPSGAVPAGLAARMKARGTVIVPTLAVQTELAVLRADPALLDDALLRAVVADNVLDAYRSTQPLDERLTRWLGVQRREASSYLASVRVLATAGVPVLVGTDAGNPGVFQGWSVHREMEKLVDAGLDPWAALAAGSTAAGAFLDLRLGVNEGDRADLVLLEASPIDDIRNTRRIHGVVQAGVVVDRATLLGISAP